MDNDGQHIQDERQGIQSIEVGVPLLAVLADHGGPMMLRDLAQAAGMPPAKAHRYLVSFARTGLVAQDPVSGRYDLGPFSLDLGLACLSRMDVVRTAVPFLERLNDETGETVALAVWGNLGPTFIRWIEARRPVTVNLRTGAVMPLLHSATGLCFVAFMDAAAVREKTGEALELALRGEDQRPPRDRAELDRIVAEARDHGLTRMLGALIPGINGFAAPVFDHEGKMVLAVTVLGPAGLLSPAWGGPIPRALRTTALAISRNLGWKPPARDSGA
ncbi:MAG: IclR family transcriptional regulator [Rhodocyclaceae bacterium]|nr:IclR family transcriptional regulator [Rhodocyclaceae bacterium]